MFLKIRKRGLKLSKNKFHIGVKSIVFLGPISSESVKVDPAKIEAITKIPLPTSVKGMTTYLGKFIPNRTSNLSPSYTAKERS